MKEDLMENTNFYEKIDGIRSRKKFRLRTYSDQLNDSPLIFLEQKSRFENHVKKFRIDIKNEDLDYFYNQNKIFNLLDQYKHDLVKSFVYDYYKKKIRPKVLVDYFRTPYISNYDINFRLTFDQNIVVSKSKNLFNSKNMRINSLPDKSILEIKFYRRIPSWFHKILMGYNLERISISKFVLAIKDTKYAIDLS